MAEILYFNKLTSQESVEQMYGIKRSELYNPALAGSRMLVPNVPYLIGKRPNVRDRQIQNLLKPVHVSKEIGDHIAAMGGDTTLDLAEFSQHFRDYNAGLIGATTNDYEKELEAISQRSRDRRLVRPLGSVGSGIKMLNNRKITRLHFKNRLQAENLVKYTRHAKVLGDGLVAIDLAHDIDIWNRRNVSGKVERKEWSGPPYRGEYPATTPWETVQIKDGLDFGDLAPAKKFLQIARALTVTAEQARTVIIGDIQDYKIYEYDEVFDLVNGKKVNIQRKFSTETFVRRESKIKKTNVRSKVETRTCYVVLGC